jgi:thiamine pyrophosphokinase
MNVVIFANGEPTAAVEAITYAQRADLIIAVDGGGNHCHRLGIEPDILLGDLDSINSEVLKYYRKNSVLIQQYPTEKDKTDLELALDLAVIKQATQVTVFAALGGRWDMSLANLLILAVDDYAGLDITIIEQRTKIGVCRGGETKLLEFPHGTTVSFIPLAGDAAGVTFTGFKYPLTNQTLGFGSGCGVSNVLIGGKGMVTVGSGVLLWTAIVELPPGVNIIGSVPE